MKNIIFPFHILLTILILDLNAYANYHLKRQIGSIRTKFSGLGGPFHENLVYWQKPIIAIF